MVVSAVGLLRNTVECNSVDRKLSKEPDTEGQEVEVG